jgi:hypothetical protein
MPLQIRRGTRTDLDNLAQPLAPGELVFVTDEQKLYIGTTQPLVYPQGIAVTGYTDEDAQDTVAKLFLGGSAAAQTPVFDNLRHSGITFAYDDVANRLDAAVDLSAYSGTIAFSQLDSDIIPTTNETYDLGSDSKRFTNLYLIEGFYLGYAQIQSNGTTINLPAGSTVDGSPIAAFPEGGQLKINIVGSDSSVIVDSENNTVTGTFVGDLKGSVFGDGSSRIIDGTDSSIHTTHLSISSNSIISDNTRVDIGSPDTNNSLYLFSQANGAFLNQYGLTDSIGQVQPWINFNISNGTLTEPEPLVADDVLSGMMLFGHDGSNYSRSVTIGAQVDVGATVSTGIVPGKFIVVVQTAVSGESTQLTFNSKGVLAAPVMQVGVYETTPTDTRPTPVKGMIIFNDTSGVFEGYNGAAWVPLG